MITYVGRAANGDLSAGITIPDDGVSKRNAASVGVPFQQLADGIALQRSRIDDAQAQSAALAIRSAQALNWQAGKIVGASVTVGGSVLGATKVQGGAWDPQQRWWAIWGIDGIRTTSDDGATWSTWSTPPFATITDGAFGGGNSVFATQGNRIHRNYGTTTVDVLGTASTEYSCVAYAKGFFIWLGDGGAIYRSPDGTAGSWVRVATLSGGTFAQRTRTLSVSPVTGTVIAAAFDQVTGRTLMLRSENGGLTWSTLATASVFPRSDVATMRCLDKGNGSTVWMLSSARNAAPSTVQSSVFVSRDDGVTWSLAWQSTTSAIVGQAATNNGIYSSWVAIDANTNRVIYSLDDGATWRYAGVSLSIASGIISVAGGHPNVVISSPYGLAIVQTDDAAAANNLFIPGLRLSAAGEVVP
ncbi:sialidase family protein [Labilithrix luteola]|uniref:sialidase family protein n=1 Tax=Labilithrix luteola TaxID=1391654 RepID=UPI0011BADD8E|nr:sialidase family protein [Labilithrix luteola]